MQDFCGLTAQRSCELLGAQRGTVYHRMTAHRDLPKNDERYRRIVARIARRALDLDWPPRNTEPA